MASYNIGLDFGTTNSIISYLENGKLEVFKYDPLGSKDEYIPSFIAYEDDIIEIGTPARNTSANHPNITSYGNFKMQLPLSESQLSLQFPNHHPINITTDYLRELLISSENPYSFQREKGEITNLVVSVPEIWQRDIYNLGRERLQKIIKENLGLGEKLIQLVSEPVAAAAYYAWETQRNSQQNHTEKFTGNLLVCDMGGGTFDVSICRIYGDKKVEVLYFDGAGNQGLNSAGVAFDTHCVQTAYLKKHHHTLPENDPEFRRLLREFETIKIGSHVKITRQLINYFKEPDIYADKNLYVFSGGYNVTIAEVVEAFTSISQGIKKVMLGVKNWLEVNNQTFARLFLVGGFSQFYLVQKAITDALEINENDCRFDRSFNIANSAYAISYGACLIANGLVEPTEKYLHTLGIFIHQEVQNFSIRGVGSEFAEKYITLIQGGLSLDKLNQAVFYNEPVIAWQESFPVPIWIEPNSQGKRYRPDLQIMIQLPNYSQSAKYLVGMRVNNSQIAYLIIEEIDSKIRVEYELGNIITQLFPGFFQPED